MMPIKPSSLLSFFRMGHTNQPQQVFMPHCWEPPSPFSIFFCGRRQQPNSPWLSPCQCTAKSKKIVIRGPQIILLIIQNSVYPAVLCHSAATSRVCNGSRRPNTEGWYKPTGEGSTPRNTASERPSSRTICGKASPTQPLLAGTQTPPSWPHPGLQDFQKWN